MASLKWLTRVPLTIKQAKELVSQRQASRLPKVQSLAIVGRHIKVYMVGFNRDG